MYGIQRRQRRGLFSYKQFMEALCRRSQYNDHYGITVCQAKNASHSVVPRKCELLRIPVLASRNFNLIKEKTFFQVCYILVFLSLNPGNCLHKFFSHIFIYLFIYLFIYFVVVYSFLFSPFFTAFKIVRCCYISALVLWSYYVSLTQNNFC